MTDNSILNHIYRIKNEELYNYELEKKIIITIKYTILNKRYFKLKIK